MINSEIIKLPESKYLCAIKLLDEFRMVHFLIFDNYKNAMSYLEECKKEDKDLNKLEKLLNRSVPPEAVDSHIEYLNDNEHSDKILICTENNHDVKIPIINEKETIYC